MQLKMSDVVVALFEKSNSFAEAKERMTYLEELTAWRPDFSERIKTGLEGNSQIHNANRVPDRIAVLLKQWG